MSLHQALAWVRLFPLHDLEGWNMFILQTSAHNAAQSFNHLDNSVGVLESEFLPGWRMALFLEREWVLGASCPSLLSSLFLIQGGPRMGAASWACPSQLPPSVLCPPILWIRTLPGCCLVVFNLITGSSTLVIMASCSVKCQDSIGIHTMNNKILFVFYGNNIFFFLMISFLLLPITESVLSLPYTS